MALIAKKSKLKKKKKTLSAAERRTIASQRAFANTIRKIFGKAGFSRIKGAENKEFVFDGLTSDVDDVFKYENVYIVVEHTLSNSANTGSHLKNKAHVYTKIRSDPGGFLDCLGGISPAMKESLNDYYIADQRIVRILYCTRSEVSQSHKLLCPEVGFLSQGEIRYFHRLATTIRRSSRFEIFDFLNIDPVSVGIGGVVKTGTDTNQYHGSLLPEAHSNFPAGYKVVSFYVDPGSVLRRAYVLRRDGWRDSLSLYQRMIVPQKIAAIRKYLREKHRVFANNVVLTLPDDTELLGLDARLLDAKLLKKSTPVQIRIPDKPNCIGVVDGQHRIFSYYEDVEVDPLIDKYRSQQNLLATGIIYPESTPSDDKVRFEAGLFLEINSNQASAKSDLKQAISLILEPFAALSVARQIVQRLSQNGPLQDVLERNAFDTGKLKTTSIVSYGIQPLTKLTGSDSLYHIWPNAKKGLLKEKNNSDLLEAYIEFSVTHIRGFMILVKKVLPAEAWTIKTKTGPGILTVTSVNSLIILMRLLIGNGIIGWNKISCDLSGLTNIDFAGAKSSQYAALAQQMYQRIAPTKSLLLS